MKPEKLINWGAVSRLLCGQRSSLTRKRIPAIHQDKIEALLKAINDWQNNNQPLTKINEK